MKNLKWIMLISIFMLGISVTSLQAQKKERKESRSSDKAEMHAKLDGYILIKAIERKGKFAIKIDAGLNKEGQRNVIYRNEKEQQLLEKTISSGSLITVLDLLDRAGYKVKQTYAVTNSDMLVEHYYLLSFENIDFDDSYQSNKKRLNQKRSNQNKPKLSPEEIEKRRKIIKNRKR